jgi:uncharacterized protein (TIGR03437 family)
MIHPLFSWSRAAVLLIAILLLFPASVSNVKGAGVKGAWAKGLGASRALARSKVWRPSVVQDPCSAVSPINVGQNVNGKLETTDCVLNDGSFADLYVFYGFAGEQISIALNSTAFDAYLFLADSNFNVIGEDDDGGGGSNARIPPGSGFVSLPATDTYFIVANSFDAGQVGDYTLQLSVSGNIVTSASAASFSSAQLAASSIVAAFSGGLATQTAVASGLPLPTSLGGSKVEVTDTAGQTRLAPLFFVSPSQVNYLMPAGTAAGVAVVKITGGDGQTTLGAAPVATVAPGIFSANASGKDVAAAVALRVKGDGTQTYEPVAQFNAATNSFAPVPIDLGPETDQIILLLFGTGLRGRSALSGVQVTIGGAAAQVVFADAQGSFDGLDQINVQAPRALIGRGDVDVAVTVDGKAANIVSVRIK